MKEYRYLSKDLLIQNNYRVEFEEDGTPKVMSYKRNKQGQEIAMFTIGGRHKHKTSQQPYLFVGLMINGTISGTYSLARVVWAWCKGECPEDMTVDHIDNKHSTAYDNRIDNLQLLSLSDNLKKRGYSRNQYTYHLSNEQIEKRKKLAVELESVQQRKRDTKGMVDQFTEVLYDLKEKLENTKLELDKGVEEAMNNYNNQVNDLCKEINKVKETIIRYKKIHKDLVNDEKELIKARRCK